MILDSIRLNLNENLTMEIRHVLETLPVAFGRDTIKSLSQNIFIHIQAGEDLNSV